MPPVMSVRPCSAPSHRLREPHVVYERAAAQPRIGPFGEVLVVSEECHVVLSEKDEFVPKTFWDFLPLDGADGGDRLRHVRAVILISKSMKGLCEALQFAVGAVPAPKLVEKWLKQF